MRGVRRSLYACSVDTMQGVDRSSDDEVMGVIDDSGVVVLVVPAREETVGLFRTCTTPPSLL